MSSSFAIAAVTAVLRDLLNNGLIDHDVSGILDGNVSVSALPPDRLPVIAGEESSQLNVFLYEILNNCGWSNRDYPSHDARGNRIARPPLAIDLRYLVSAYGAQDLHAEMLLGYAMQLLHETPVLSRAAISRALDPTVALGGVANNLPPGFQSLAEADLADQVESIRITPHFLNLDDMSRIWTSSHAHFRPSMAYHVSVLLIESSSPTRAALPILTRGPNDRGVSVEPNLLPQTPTLTAALYPAQQAAIRLGETLTLEGLNLSGTNARVHFESMLLDDPLVVSPATPDEAADDFVRVQIPGAPSTWIAGSLSARVLVQRPGDTFERESNTLPVILAPAIQNVNATRDANDVVTLEVQCEPEIRPRQRVSLLVGTHEIPSPRRNSATDTIAFMADDLAAGEYLVRLRVDGAESIYFDRSATPPAFFASERIKIP